MSVVWLHEARTEDGQRFRIGRDGPTRIAEWESLLRVEVPEDGPPRVESEEDSLTTRKLHRGAVPALLGHLDGHLHWHASACVRRRGSALLVLGDAGAGKSTLVAGLCGAGAAYLADDVAGVEQGARGWLVRRCEDRHALRVDMAAQVFGHTGTTKTVFVPHRLRTRAKLGLVVALSTGPELSLYELSMRQKVQLLSRHLVRFALDDERRLQRDLDVVLTLVASVPVCSLVCPRPFEDWDGLTRLLDEKLRGDLEGPP